LRRRRAAPDVAGIDGEGRLDMSSEAIFEWGSRLVVTGWLALIAGLFLRRARGALFAYGGYILPAIGAVIYLALLVAAVVSGTIDPDDLGGLAGLHSIYATDLPLVAAWYHFLALDLFVGGWILRDGLARGARSWLLIPVLALTFLAGPLGLLAWLLLRAGPLRAPAEAAR
jgi:hypothetical protein